MMITDLIDQDDYFNIILGAGVPLAPDCSPEQCSRALLAWLPLQDAQTRAGCVQLLAELQKQTPIMLPEVQSALALLLNDELFRE
ncbi:hypothetical protein [Amphritea sp.]|uniref:hypothetical protein n=1 Tax=Amphritea sp. TaxID=1872502 RepID=UPI003D0E08FD